MIRVTSSRRRYRMTRRPLLNRVLWWIAALIPLATAVYVALNGVVRKTVVMNTGGNDAKQ